jgi:hypothetical protein
LPDARWLERRGTMVIIKALWNEVKKKNVLHNGYDLENKSFLNRYGYNIFIETGAESG